MPTAPTTHRVDGSYRRGINWMPERGKLYRFTESSVTVIRPWPLPQAWSRLGVKPWQGCRPHVNLRAAGPRPSGPRPSGRWGLRYPHIFEGAAWATVPEDIRGLVLGCAFSLHQWSALGLAARCPDARPLMAEVPLLAAGLSCVNALRRLQGRAPLTHPWRSARSVSRRGWGWSRWRHLSGWLGLPDDRAFVRVLRRIGAIEGGHWGPEDLVDIGRLWGVPAGRKLLQHLPALNGHLVGALRLGLYDPGILGSLCYRLLADADTPVAQANLVRTLQSLSEFRYRLETPPALPIMSNLAQVERARDAAATVVAELMCGGDNPFPPPPLEGDAYVWPLSSLDVLTREGREMGHCVGDRSWGRLARMRTGYGYRIVVFERREDQLGFLLDLRRGSTGVARGPCHRGTAWVVPFGAEPGRFRLEQLQGPQNSEPHPEVSRRLAGWLKAHDEAWLHRAGRLPPSAHKLPPPPEESWLVLRPPAPWLWARGPAGAPLGPPYEDDDIPF